MKSLQVYDPPMCCSTGVCGPAIDPAVVNFAAMLTRLAKHGIHIERYNLAQQPSAFVENPVVKALLDTEGAAALPLMVCDGLVHLKGRYPNDAERAAFLQAAVSSAAEAQS